MLGPRGEILPLPVSALGGSPFDTYFVPWFILFGVLGLGPLVAALLVWIRHPLAPFAKAIVNAAKRGVRDSGAIMREGSRMAFGKGPNGTWPGTALMTSVNRSSGGGHGIPDRAPAASPESGV
jgi:hypothetical protein